MSDQDKKKLSEKPKPLNRYIRFSGMAIQMGVIIGLSAWGGSALDEKFKTSSKVFTIILSLLGIGVAMYLVIREVIKMQKEDEG